MSLTSQIYSVITCFNGVLVKYITTEYYRILQNTTEYYRSVTMTSYVRGRSKQRRKCCSSPSLTLFLAADTNVKMRETFAGARNTDGYKKPFVAEIKTKCGLRQTKYENEENEENAAEANNCQVGRQRLYLLRWSGTADRHQARFRGRYGEYRGWGDSAH